MHKQTFYSNGKLLITGEYVVLDGAKGLALPTKFGQNLIVSKGNNSEISWTSYDVDGSVWFKDTLSFSEIKNKAITKTNSNIKNTLITILHQANLQNNTFLKESGYVIETHLTFPRFWGLGTSSTLINNISQWLNIEAFELLNKSYGGSGYDIACAQINQPILYYLENQKPKIEIVNFDPIFKKDIYFVYLNIKQSSKLAISNYKAKKNQLDEVISKINKITEETINCTDSNHLKLLIEKHESILSIVLETKTVKKELFNDFNGTIKSLGAWGGDFIMVISKENPSSYFENKGYKIILPYTEMVL